MESMESFFQNIRNANCPEYTDGYAENVGEFFDRYVLNTLPKKETIEGWDKILNKYVNDKDAILFVRRYSNGKNGDENIRRGFLTVFQDGFKYAYADNFFAHFFYIMAINNFVPDYDDFKSFILTRKMPFGSIQTSGEKQNKAFKNLAFSKIWANGWKLSHILETNKNYTFDYTHTCKQLFPRGIFSDWDLTDEKKKLGFDYPVRYITENLSDEDKNRIKAHFLRFVHPINYFLTPGKNHCTTSCNYNDIGEYAPAVAYMGVYNIKNYPEIFNNYIKNTLSTFTADTSLDNISKEEIDLSFTYEVDKSDDDTPKATKPKADGNVKAGSKAPKKQEISYSADWIDDTIGHIAQYHLVPLLEKMDLTDDLLNKLQDASYSKEYFGINFAVLSKERAKTNGVSRYYASPITLNGEDFYLCSQWFNNHKSELVEWIMNNDENAICESLSEEDDDEEEKEETVQVNNSEPWTTDAVGHIARFRLGPLLEKITLSPVLLKQLQTLESSKEIFDLNFPLLSKERVQTNGVYRYYANDLIINHEHYYLCSQWYARQKDLLVQWILDHAENN